MMRTFQHHVSVFGQARELSFFNADGIDSFVAYLRCEAGLQEITVRKNYKNLIWFLNWAVRKGYLPREQLFPNKHKFKIVQKPIIFLKREELLRLYHYIVPPTGTVVTLRDLNGNEYTKRVKGSAAITRARDLFCFCAFTSLRYSDMAKLCRSDIPV